MKVLAVDDDPVARTFLRQYLGRWGYDVDTVETGADAWRKYRENDYAIVLTDWLMPEMDGIDLVERIRDEENAPYVYIILVTIRGEITDIVEGMEAGADDYVSKPYATGELRVRLEAGKRIVNLERSVGEKRRRLDAAHDSLVQSEKMAAIGRLVLGLSHEINNPLSLVTSGIQYLREKLGPAIELLEWYETRESGVDQLDGDSAEGGEQARERVDFDSLSDDLDGVLERLERGSRRIEAIVEKLTDFAGYQPQALDEVDTAETIRRTVEMVEKKLETRGLELDLAVRDVPPVVGEERRIRQVISNLLLNAIEASESGDTIRLRTRCHDESPLEEPAVELVVEDEGTGIPEEIRGQVFDPFFTTDESGTATGLGLFLCYQVVRQHRGEIELSSTPGEGTRAVVWLPVEQEPLGEIPGWDKPWASSSETAATESEG